ncbi:urea carboxylase-associated protein 1/urea carboxylase-associated protein 2 [Methylobacterium phyllostachyos]|uniref:Urea carboxylase-associated protein 1/urea carboxylase-associated protein 2 n=2 Tax=Methylobacterium phyllostachyos TaxID=582672 RepID=A0A1H0KQW5_9HYPH|nr:urea carboxylase-associated protein 1/urea carboxylase-associated protein 2 [Methylobacterium phyllostachyos]
MSDDASRITENRRRYEELKRAGQGHAPRALPGPSPRDGAPIPPEAVLHRETIPGGWYWTTTLKAGEALRIALDHGPSSVALVAWAEADASERLNCADTIKVQWTAALAKGRVLFSDMGRVMLSLIEDSCGAHDVLAGGSTAASNAARYVGGPYRNTRDNVVLAALKRGLDKRDIPACLTLFAPVVVGAGGRLGWNEAGRAAGDFVDLRAEMDLIVALSNCPTPSIRRPPTARTRWRSPASRRLSRRRTTSAAPRRSRPYAASRITPPPDSEGSRTMTDTHDTPVLDQVVPAAAPFSALVRKGQTIRIEDLKGCQAVDTLFYRADDLSERYSAQDTARAQGAAYITTGTKVLSNEGRVMLTVTADSCGRHDTSAGACSCESNTVRFGHATKYLHACRENFALEIAKYGLSKRDIVPNINFFMNVPIEQDGKLAIVDGVSKPGDAVELTAEMDVICVISNCPQINNPCNGFNPTPIRVTIRDGI